MVIPYMANEPSLAFIMSFHNTTVVCFDNIVVLHQIWTGGFENADTEIRKKAALTKMQQCLLAANVIGKSNKFHTRYVGK